MQRSPSVAARAPTDQASAIDTNALIYSARMVSGNFAPIEPGLVERVTRLVDWLNAQPALPPARRSEVELQLRKLLATRLRLAADRARLPEIAGETIKRPIFVIGFARTGTSLLHSLLAEDPGALAPKWWHTHEPSPPPGEVPVVDSRIELAAQDLDRLLHQAPGLLTLHPYWDKRGHCLIEDEEIFTLDFQNAYPSLLYRVPALAMILDASNIGAAYQFHREFLQHLQWNQPGKHWVLKGIYHQFVLDELFYAYPDAVCIWPHRDPVEVYPSMLAITAVLYGAITDWTMDFEALGPAFVQSIRQSLDRTLANPLVDDPRIFHVAFHEFSRDPIGTVGRAYAQWDLPFTHDFEARMQAWLANPANSANRYGRYDYRFEPFGLSRDMLAHIFSDYRARFCHSDTALAGSSQCHR
jgi:Sulfotransferase family